MKKPLSLFISLFIFLTTIFIFPVNAMDNNSDLRNRLSSIDGMGASVYAYLSSKTYNPTPMMTPVIFVYNNNGYSDIDDVWQTANDSGLIQLAEKEKALILFLDSINKNGNYTEDDIKVYKEITKELAKSDNKFGLTTYQNLMYLIGEGNGATFINNYMSQNANRIAGTLLFGGTINDNIKNTMSLPAYLVGGNDNIVNFYKTINKATKETSINGNKVFFNPNLTTEKVIVNSQDVKSLNKEIINDAWNSMLRYITRNVMGRCVWAETYNMTSGGSKEPITEVFTLMDRIIPEEHDLTFNQEVTEQEGEDEVYPGVWYEWIPNEALDENNTKKYSLVMCYHGSGDHPVFEAECNGWVELAAKERIIVVSPEWQSNVAYNADADVNKRFIDYLCKKYPIDTSKIYATGFSAGSGQTLSVASKYPEIFAGIAPLAVPTNNTKLSVDENLYSSID